jgi:hypothetical protein
MTAGGALANVNCGIEGEGSGVVAVRRSDQNVEFARVAAACSTFWS